MTTPNDYLRSIAADLEDAGVDQITPAQLEDLAYFLDVWDVEANLKYIAEQSEE